MATNHVCVAEAWVGFGILHDYVAHWLGEARRSDRDALHMGQRGGVA